jgi:hypothetical protein
MMTDGVRCRTKWATWPSDNLCSNLLPVGLSRRDAKAPMKSPVRVGVGASDLKQSIMRRSPLLPVQGGLAGQRHPPALGV